MATIRYVLFSLIWPTIRQVKPFSEGAKAKLQDASNPWLRVLKSCFPFITANVITGLRLPLGAAAWFYFYFGSYDLAFWILAAAAATDALDGLWARANKENTAIGNWFGGTKKVLQDICLLAIFAAKAYQLDYLFSQESANALMGIACGFAFLTTWVKFKEA